MTGHEKEPGASPSPEPPMLVLGEDRPDVEDTTLEQLRREQEQARQEIEAARRRAQEEIERRRREAEREIAELEAQKERELLDRERDLERTQRKLYQREKRLLRRVPQGARKPDRLVEPPRKAPLAETGLRRSAWAVLLGAGAAVAIVVGALSGGTSADGELRAEIAATDEARVLWLRSGLEADAAIAQLMAGQEVAASPDGSYPNVALAREAVALVPEPTDYADRAAEATERMLDPQTGTVRALTLWGDVHDESGYAVGHWEVEDLVEEADGPSGWTYALMVAGILALLVLAGLAVAAKAWVALPLVLVAAGLAVASTMLVAGDGRAVSAAFEAHEEADDRLDQVHDQLGRDLQTAYGTNRSALADDEDYWTRDPFYGEASPALDPFLAARPAVGEAIGEGDAAAAGAALGLVRTARATFEAQVPAMEQSRAALVRSLEGSAAGRAGVLLLALGSAAVAAAALLLSRGRGRAA